MLQMVPSSFLIRNMEYWPICMQKCQFTFMSMWFARFVRFGVLLDILRIYFGFGSFDSFEHLRAAEKKSNNVQHFPFFEFYGLSIYFIGFVAFCIIYWKCLKLYILCSISESAYFPPTTPSINKLIWDGD